MSYGTGVLNKPRQAVNAWVWIVDALLAGVAGSTMAATVAGPWIADGFGWAMGLVVWLLSLVGASVSVPGLMSVVVLGMITVTVLDLWDFEANKPALISLILMFSVALGASGGIAEFALTLADWWREIGDATFGALLGG